MIVYVWDDTAKGNLEMISNNNCEIIKRDSKSIYNAIKYLLDNPEAMKKLGDTPALNFADKQTTINNIEKTF